MLLRRILPCLAVAAVVAVGLPGCTTVSDAISDPIATPSATPTQSTSEPNDRSRDPSEDSSDQADQVIDPCSDAQRAAIEMVIDGQLQAFVADDWAGALEFATPSFRDRFDADDLGTMIEQSFPIVANQVEADHHDCLVAGREARVLSTVTDEAGDAVALTYLMESADGQTWLIGGAVPTEPVDDGGQLI